MAFTIRIITIIAFIAAMALILLMVTRTTATRTTVAIDAIVEVLNTEVELVHKQAKGKEDNHLTWESDCNCYY